MNFLLFAAALLFSGAKEALAVGFTPANGAIVVPGSTFVATAPVNPTPTASYSISFGNGIYVQTSTLGGNTLEFTLSVPTNYVGSYTLEALQGDYTSAVTYGLQTVSPVWNPVDPNLRFHIEDPIQYRHRRH
jgi:hypothetical protein